MSSVARLLLNATNIKPRQIKVGVFRFLLNLLTNYSRRVRSPTISLLPCWADWFDLLSILEIEFILARRTYNASSAFFIASRSTCVSLGCLLTVPCVE